MSELVKYYSILGLSPVASADEVKKAYRKMVMLYHPDKNPDPAAHQHFLLCVQAYEIIIGKRAVPSEEKVHYQQPASTGTSQRRSASSRSGMTREERIRRAQEYQRRQEEEERIYHEGIYNKITRTFRWTVYRCTCIFLLFYALALIIDDFLPTYFEKVTLDGIEMDVPGWRHERLLELHFEEGGSVCVPMSEIWYDLKSNSYYNDEGGTEEFLLYKSGWLKIEKKLCKVHEGNRKCYSLDRNLSSIRYLIVILCILPFLNFYFRTTSYGFLLRYYATQYGIVAIAVLSLILEGRFVHLFTLGYM